MLPDFQTRVFLSGLSLALCLNTAVAGPIDNLQPGHWYEVANTRLETEFPTPTPAGYSGPSSVMDAWSGGAYDSKRDRLIVWGGGHMDYSGNEVYVFDINTLVWTRLDEPSNPITENPPDGRNPDGRPASRHTYNYLQYAPNVDRFFSLGFSAAYGAPSTDGHQVDAYNFDTLSWSPKATKPNNGTSIGAISAYDSGTGLLWQHGALSGELASYNPVNNTWSSYTSSLFLEYYATAAIDPTRHIMVAVGGNQFYVWDLNNPNADPTSPSTTGPNLKTSQSPGFVYDPVSDKFVGWDGGSSVYVLDADTWTWTQVGPAGDNTVTPTSAETRGTNGRFRYIPSKNAFIVVNRTYENVYFYKLTAGGGSTPGPTLFFSSSPSAVTKGGYTTLDWNSPTADSCTATGDWNGSKNTTGSESVGPINSQSLFVLTCQNTDGQTNSSVTVRVGGSTTSGDSGGGSMNLLTLLILFVIGVLPRYVRYLQRRQI